MNTVGQCRCTAQHLHRTVCEQSVLTDWGSLCHRSSLLERKRWHCGQLSKVPAFDPNSSDMDQWNSDAQWVTYYSRLTVERQTRGAEGFNPHTDGVSKPNWLSDIYLKESILWCVISSKKNHNIVSSSALTSPPSMPLLDIDLLILCQRRKKQHHIWWCCRIRSTTRIALLGTFQQNKHLAEYHGTLVPSPKQASECAHLLR